MTEWRRAGPVPALDTGAVHVWRVSLEGNEALCVERMALLSPDERARAERFRMAWDTRRSILARSALRTILAAYLDAAPASLSFDYGPHGKPALSSPSTPLSFNVSHSDDLALIAVRAGGPVGVDVERVRADVGGDEIAERFFCPAERAWLLSLPPAWRPEGFFTLWTRKEAYIKGRGSGLWHDLNSFDVSQSPPLPVQAAGADKSWFVWDLSTGAGHAAALAVEDGADQVLTWDFDVTSFP